MSEAIWPMVRARMRLVGGRATPVVASIDDLGYVDGLVHERTIRAGTRDDAGAVAAVLIHPGALCLHLDVAAAEVLWDVYAMRVYVVSLESDQHLTEGRTSR